MARLEPRDDRRDTDRLMAALVVVASLAFAASPLMSAGFNGFTPGQFPNPQTDPPVQPAGYAFAIWGLIYLWLLAGAVFGLVRRDSDANWRAMRPPLLVSLAIGAAWIPVANLSPVWATALIWVMLAGAIVALMRAGPTDRPWMRSPVALYAGWLTAASCVALGLVLAGHGIVDMQVAALAMIALALAIALAVLALRPDTPEYAAAVIWALVGIIAANAAGPNLPVVILAGVGIVLLAWQARRGATAGR